METVTFRLADDERFERLATIVGALSEAKSADDFGDANHWESFLDRRSRAAFWWPTDAELAAWERRWFATPIQTRWTDPTLQTPWTFGSVIAAASNGEFVDLVCRRTSASGGVIEFVPTAWPFGGTGWMRALVEAFGGEVTDVTAG